MTIVSRRMLETLVTCPNVNEFTTALMFEKYGVLKMLVACIRNSSARDSRTVIVLLSAISNVNWAGPSMILRPASP
jgi:hypothetical protein